MATATLTVGRLAGRKCKKRKWYT